MLGLDQIWCPYSKWRQLVTKGYYYSTSINNYVFKLSWEMGFYPAMRTQKIRERIIALISWFYVYKVIFPQVEEFCAYLCTRSLGWSPVMPKVGNQTCSSEWTSVDVRGEQWKCILVCPQQPWSLGLLIQWFSQGLNSFKRGWSGSGGKNIP